MSFGVWVRILLLRGDVREGMMSLPTIAADLSGARDWF
jgi:hypothetical protein